MQVNVRSYHDMAMELADPRDIEGIGLACNFFMKPDTLGSIVEQYA